MKRILFINNKNILVDNKGFLINFYDWSREFSEFSAKIENIFLSEKHWKIIFFVRDFYKKFNIIPGIRIISRILQKKMFLKKVNSIFFLKLFSINPVKKIHKISGLPRTFDCM